MRKMTVLDIVQEVLNDMDSDPVNSIDETFEAQQVASLVQTVYRNMISNRNWSHTKKLLNLTPYSKGSLPTHMRIKDEVKELICVDYNTAKKGETRRRYQRLVWLEPDDFLRVSNQLNTDTDYVDVVIDPSGVELAIRNNQAPKYFTSFDDDTLVFDAYDSDVDDTLQASKTQAYGFVMPSFTVSDTFVPDLPLEAFSALVSEVKSQAFIKLKQQESGKDEQDSRRQQSWLSRKEWRVQGGVKYPDYGRRGRGMSRGNPFDKSSYVGRLK